MNRQTLAIFLLGAVLAGLGARFFFQSNPDQNALRARELATRGLAEELARTRPGHRALIVANPFTQRQETAPAIVDTEEAGIRGLRLGFGNKMTAATVAYPELKSQAFENPRELLTDPETSTPLSYLVTPDSFDKLARKHADCDIMVSLIGLPAELGQSEAWKAEGAPGFALLLPDLRMIGDVAAVQRALRSGKLLAFVLRKPGGLEDSAPVGKDIQSEFDKRFILVTAGNVEQVLRTYPSLF